MAYSQIKENGGKMPYIKIWIHLIFSTKNRKPLITSKLKAELIQHIKTNAKEKGIYIDFLNAVEDHIHLLISLGNDQNISNIVKLIKGESSHWINKNKLIGTKFEWQEEYIALSVSDSMVDKVRNYIKNQEIHHKKLSFSEEYEILLKKLNIGLKPQGVVSSNVSTS